MIKSQRLQAALRASGFHLLCSLVIGLIAATLVFGLWYPYPYGNLSGGRNLFLLIISIDVVCGPILTAVVFNTKKPRSELWRDLGLVFVVQLGALSYGLNVVWHARPVYLVQEVDRFKVITLPELEAPAVNNLEKLLQPRWNVGPMIVAIREPKDAQERQKVMFESVQGGRDYAERADFYIRYEGDAAAKSLQKAKNLRDFLKKFPQQENAAKKVIGPSNSDFGDFFYLPIVARQDWIAILDRKGMIQGFLKGDGF
ncbi:pilus assembly protein [Acidovorax sp.]|uniref:pilus assembly protein n=1 Tax=Acidovorax sp. TaxID=1872122 RepID=UPI002637833D|nr:pilus assembly protein [Acidovorax sp.]